MIFFDSGVASSQHKGGGKKGTEKQSVRSRIKKRGAHRHSFVD